jgi:hypothetical protein
VFILFASVIAILLSSLTARQFEEFPKVYLYYRIRVGDGEATFD